ECGLDVSTSGGTSPLSTSGTLPPARFTGLLRERLANLTALPWNSSAVVRQSAQSAFMAVTRGIRFAAWAVAGALLVAACTSSGPSSAPSPTSGSASSGSSASATEAGIQKIKHVVIIMQENRSFDSFFG